MIRTRLLVPVLAGLLTACGGNGGSDAEPDYMDEYGGSQAVYG